MIELLCPAFGDEQNLSAANSTQPEAVFSAASKRTVEIGNSISATDAQDHSAQSQILCHDECLCHATAILNFVLPSLKSPIFPRDRIVSYIGDHIPTALPPPFQPPKFS